METATFTCEAGDFSITATCTPATMRELQRLASLHQTTGHGVGVNDQ